LLPLWVLIGSSGSEEAKRRFRGGKEEAKRRQRGESEEKLPDFLAVFDRYRA